MYLSCLNIVRPFNIVLEIDTVGTYNMCKAVYDHCFKVHTVTIVVTKEFSLFHFDIVQSVVGLRWDNYQHQCHTTLLWDYSSGQKTCLLPIHTHTHTHTHTLF